MIEGGEDPRFIARRMVILASEDVGNADPQALQVAVAAAHAVEHVGHARGVLRARPVRDLPLARAEVERGRRRARRGARARARAGARSRRPPYLQSAAYPGAAQLGRGQGYDYPHGNPSQVSDQELLPDALVGHRFYAPGATEAALRERLERIRRARGRPD